MKLFRVVLAIGVVAAPFLFSALVWLVVNRSTLPPLPLWFWAIIILLFVSQHLIMVIVYSRRRIQELNRRDEISKIYVKLSQIMELPLLLENKDLERGALELTAVKFCEQFNEYPLRHFFVRVDLSEELINEYPNLNQSLIWIDLSRRPLKPQDRSIESAFYDDIRDRFNSYLEQDMMPSPLVLSSSEIFPVIIGRREYIAELAYGDPILGEKPVRKIARVKFGGKYCLVLPLTSKAFLPDERSKQANKRFLLGYIGLVTDERFTNLMIGELRDLPHRFLELYTRIISERITLRIDSFMNRSQVDRLKESKEGQRIPEIFADKLRSILKQEFHADGGVQIQLKGMVEKTKGEKKPKSHYLELDIELHGCKLGSMCISRKKPPFSVRDSKLLEKIEDEIDNYVRDLWEEHVLRQIDHNVFNQTKPNLKEFSALLIREIVKEFDAFHGKIEVEKNKAIIINSEYPENEIEGAKEIIRKVIKECKNYLDQRNGIEEGTHWLFVPLSLKKQERLGAIYLIGKNRFTDVHKHALKRLEGNIDNIVKLYLVLEQGWHNP